jgi:hypothetical protein
MKKKLLGLLSLALIGLLVGCEEGTMIYEDKERPISEVEEIIADELEVENPEMDLMVDIAHETE